MREDSTKISNFYSDDSSFEEDLALAWERARSRTYERALEFLNTLDAKYEKYGLQAFLTERQFQFLSSLAEEQRR